MKLSLFYMSSVGSFLSVTTVGMLWHGYPMGAIAKNHHYFSQIAVLIPPQLDSLFKSISEGKIETSCTGTLHFCREGDLFASSSDLPPSPPVPERSGGSR